MILRSILGESYFRDPGRQSRESRRGFTVFVGAFKLACGRTSLGRQDSLFLSNLGIFPLQTPLEAEARTIGVWGEV